MRMPARRAVFLNRRQDYDERSSSLTRRRSFWPTSDPAPSGHAPPSPQGPRPLPYRRHHQAVPVARRCRPIVRPDTVIRWHRSLWRLFWRRRSRRPVGRPPIDADTRALIRRMWIENPLWGEDVIAAELAKLGHHVSPRTVAKYRPARAFTPRGHEHGRARVAPAALQAGCVDFRWGAADHANPRQLPLLRALTESQALHTPHGIIAAYTYARSFHHRTANSNK